MSRLHLCYLKGRGTDNTTSHMAKHNQTAEAAATATDLSDLELRISEITQQVKERFGALKQEAQGIQRELERLSQRHEQLTGKALLASPQSASDGRDGR